ncbi:capsid scaffold protein [Aotine betaherpesvirus 1]|nr:capsid scaffold protein [Aotine betaherpesvirus 1]AEV80777.1 capsid scaffold protein [Aotine betaherpesvirus 1]
MAHALPTAAAPAAVAPVAPAPGAVSLSSDCVYLPKDAFFSLIGMSAGKTGAAGGAVLDAGPQRMLGASPLQPAYPSAYSYPSPLPPGGYGDSRYGAYGYGPMVGRPYDARLEYGERGRYEYPMELSYPPYPQPVRGRFQGRKRKKGGSSSEEEEEEPSFPGDVDYGSKGRKRFKNDRHGGSGSSSGGHNCDAMECEHRHGRYEDLRDVLSELRRDLAATRNAMQQQQQTASMPPPAPVPTSSAASSSNEHAKASSEKAATHAASTSAAPPIVNASCVPSMSHHQAPTPAQQQHPQKERPQNMVDFNRRLFVAALNKME